MTTTGENVSFHPPLTRSGIADVDAVLREVESADVAALLTRLRFSDVACAENPLGIGAPPKCPPGISSGTLVSVFPLDRCEEGFASLAEVEGQVRSAIARQPRLYAVHRPDRPGTGGAAFVAVLGSAKNSLPECLGSTSAGMGRSCEWAFVAWPPCLSGTLAP